MLLSVCVALLSVCVALLPVCVALLLSVSRCCLFFFPPTFYVLNLNGSDCFYSAKNSSCFRGATVGRHTIPPFTVPGFDNYLPGILDSYTNATGLTFLVLYDGSFISKTSAQPKKMI